MGANWPGLASFPAQAAGSGTCILFMDNCLRATPCPARRALARSSRAHSSPGLPNEADRHCRPTSFYSARCTTRAMDKDHWRHASLSAADQVRIHHYYTSIEARLVRASGATPQPDTMSSPCCQDTDPKLCFPVSFHSDPCPRCTNGPGETGWSPCHG